MSAELERKLRQALCEHPRTFNNRYTTEGKNAFIELLFRSLTNDRLDYFQLLFPKGFPPSYKLQDEQDAQENAEYTEAARGHACGHIFKQGEASYHCMTCTDDPTAVLCARCFGASDHEGHEFHIGTSAGNSGCCDCGDDEAWKRPVCCAIHTSTDDFMHTDVEISPLPADLQASIRTTVGCVLDYLCDVISCSPENLRTPKTVDSVQQDEVMSRLKEGVYGPGDEVESHPEFCLLLWNDEKHTVREVRDQVVRACREREAWGLNMAEKASEHGRCVVRHSRDLNSLLTMAKIIEQIKITVTIRSSRDTFREQMCETVIDWLSDIAGSTIGGDGHILRRVVCEEMLQLWRTGSQAWNAKVGREDLDDHELSENVDFRRRTLAIFHDPIQLVIQRVEEDIDEGDDENDDDDDVEITDQHDMIDSGDDEGYDILDDATTETHVIMDADPEATDDADEMDTDFDNDLSDVNDRVDVRQVIPPPPPPPLAPGTVDEPAIAANTETLSRQESETFADDQNRNFQNVPKLSHFRGRTHQNPPNHWTVNMIPRPQKDTPLYEDLRKNIRIDSMILFDLRLWKQVRTDMRDLLITTLVNIPQFKRILGLRFSGLYTTLAQLYLVADREPDHSIINLSLQLLTTPSITQEVVEKGNFLTVLMAILYTFLTTRQVGPPSEVDPEAVLGFDAGSVANRRLYHFFADLRYFLASPFIQSNVRTEKQYLFEYLDLAKLSQGICPNIRAVGEHVEYETDAWISASLLTREINKLCREFAEAFHLPPTQQPSMDDPTFQAILHTARAAIANSIGLEHQRFEQSEIRDVVKFHPVGPYPFDDKLTYKVVQFSVEKETLSFHHPLHYTLSWLLEGGKDSELALQALKDAASSVVTSLHEKNLKIRGSHLQAIYADHEDALLALFDYPLRVCAWLAQMRANLWVRNGMSLRHQMSQYKSVTYRDLGHHRDHFLLQTALVVCRPDRVLASMIDRYGLQAWLVGNFANLAECEDNQTLDIIEDFVYLIINLLSDRDSLVSRKDDSESHLASLRKDIAHTLCFKPLSYSDLTGRLNERAQDHGKLQEVLESMTNYRAPEGLHDTGLFELKEEYLEELDPYNSHFSKNQRDEAENIYKAWKAKQLKNSADDIVLEPKLSPIRSEAYIGLCKIIHDSLFVNMIHAFLTYVTTSKEIAPNVSATRVEAFTQVLLHLMLVATMEDTSCGPNNTPQANSWANKALSLKLVYGSSPGSTIFELLHTIWSLDDFSSCRPKIKCILRLLDQKEPGLFNMISSALNFPSTRFDTASPAVSESEIEFKKKQASERRKKVMAQMQQQQQSFMDKQGVIDWGEDEDETESDANASTERRLWKCPSGVCIQCREETSDSRLYGTFAMVTDGHILRQTPTDNADFMDEVFQVPRSLDRSLEDKRPFGVSGSNHEQLKRLMSDGTETVFDRQGLGQGWPHGWTDNGPVSTSCGHIMHFSCFDNYYQSISRRHTHQIARNHPEIVSLKEFVCPLCKALANVFLPIVWKGTEQSYPGVLTAPTSFDIYLDYTLPTALQQPSLIGSSDENAERNMHVGTILSFNTSAMTPLVTMLKSTDIVAWNSAQDWTEYGDHPGHAAFLELTEAYRRLRQSLEITEKTQLPSSAPSSAVKVDQFRILLETLSNSISATETAFRGKDSDYGSTLLSSMPAITLSHLQVLANSVRAYAAATALELGPKFSEQFRHASVRVVTRLLQGKFDDKSGYKPASPALETDAFLIFAEAVMTIGRSEQFPIPHLLRICLTLELTRVAAAFLWNPKSTINQPATAHRQANLVPSNSELTVVNAVVGFIERQLYAHATEGAKVQRSNETLTLLGQAMRSYALTFLRKSVIFLHTACGVDFPPLVGGDAYLPELERLTRLLKLPVITSILAEFQENSGRYSLHKLARHWVQESTVYTRHAGGNVTMGLNPIRLSHPAPFELIGLPKYFDVLIEESHKRKCPTTGRELTDPALCLFCGEIFCAQAVCCLENWKRGGCNVHLEKCSFPIGLFLFIRKCQVVLLHVVKDPKKVDQDRAKRERGEAGLRLGDMAVSHGSFFPAPYLTKHGETDPGLRSKHQLILSQKRYDKLLRDTWLMVNASVWSTIARKLEGEVNAGGWETL